MGVDPKLEDEAYRKAAAVMVSDVEFVGLVGIIQDALIKEVAESAKVNDYSFQKEPEHDGFYSFVGSLDTYMTAESIGRELIEVIPQLGPLDFPTFTIKATDRGAPEAILNWIGMAGAGGAMPGKLSGAFTVYLDMVKWQRDNPAEVHTPD